MSEPGVLRDGTGEAPGVDRRIGRRRGDRIIGASRATQAVVDQAMTAAASDLVVWIEGPNGSGKDHVARAIHAWGKRSAGPFLAVSCSAVSQALLGRELFGCAAGVYPTLPEEHAGACEAAAGGTLVVSDVDRLPNPLVSALGKAIADGRYTREGDTSPRPLRARLILTSPKSQAPALPELPHQAITIAPLSERNEDVLPLAAHFLRRYGDEEGIEPVGFTADARNALVAESWPGNARELGERVRQALRLAGSGAISAEALMLSIDGEEVPSFKEAKRAFETRYVVGLLRRCGGNISRAARLAKKDRKDFYDVIRRTGVDPSDFR